MADGVIPWRRICCKDRWSGQCLISAFGFCRIEFREKRTAVCSPAAVKRHDLSLFLLYRSYIEAGAGRCGGCRAEAIGNHDTDYHTTNKGMCRFFNDGWFDRFSEAVRQFNAAGLYADISVTGKTEKTNGR